ncbi:MAG: right-handed parallel beta-helix repeat-containing protein, partial [Phycisphaerales bacterium]|nr:right-handed parallel beta-helix repeat-containing protein [Phycisphaerales bacterium]
MSSLHLSRLIGEAADRVGLRIRQSRRSEGRGLTNWGCNGLFLSTLVAISIGVVTPVRGTVWYVDDDAAAGGDGQSWGTAFKYLQDALSAAQLDPEPEIWIAGGTYMPDQGANVTLGDREASFHLGTNMRIYGGFAGAESSVDERDVSDRTNVTILSGDLAENDSTGIHSFDENALRVLIVTNTTSNAMVDGLTISGGNPDHDLGSLFFLGGGAYASANCNAKFLHCIFRDNRGGAVNVVGSPTFVECAFRKNDSFWATVGLWNDAEETQLGHAIAINCEFSQNSGPAVWTGGSFSIHGCRFLRNCQDSILPLYGSNSLISNCTFLHNFSRWIYGDESNENLPEGFVVANCIFYGNILDQDLGDRYEKWDAICENPQFRHNLVQRLSKSSVGIGNRRSTATVTPDGHLIFGVVAIDLADSSSIGLDVLDLDHDGDLEEGTPLDFDGEPRAFDDPGVANMGSGADPFVDVGADEFVDLDMDELPDNWESRYFDDTTAGIAAADPDGDGLLNIDEYEQYSSDPVATPIFVDGSIGDDEFDGSSPEAQGGTIGPKATIQGGLDVATGGDTVLVAPGNYPISQFRGLDFAGKSIVLRSVEGADQTSLGDSFGANIDWRSIRGSFVTVEGFALTESAGIYIRESDLRLNDCSISIEDEGHGGETGLDLVDAQSRFRDVSVVAGQSPEAMAVRIVNSMARLDGELRLGGLVVFWNTWIEGNGTLILDRLANPNSRIHVTRQFEFRGLRSDYPPSPTIIHGISVRGSGDIDIDPGEILLLESGALIDLSGEDDSDECLDPAESGDWGTITVGGTLIARDSTIRNTNVLVEGGELGEATQIFSNDINLIQNPPGWGGEFFVDGTAMIECNIIRSDGDRYLDLDPDPNADPRPVIGEGPTANRIFLTITQGVGFDQGELLELRSEDRDHSVNNGLSGAYELESSDGFADPWVLERFEVMPDAKVTLTNRQGFVFQDAEIPVPEALYVKKVCLHPGAVLNTGLQRMYYQQLVDENGQVLSRDPTDPDAPLANGALIEDVPLLGYSLKTIAMEDDTEFDVRVRSRLRDPNDEQPTSPPFKEGSIFRFDDLDPLAPSNGVMAMKTHAEDRESASSVAAHGAFARAGEDEILVTFLYR